MLSLVILTNCKQKPDPQPSSPPNLLFVISDQFRPQAMEFMNQDPVITPNLDKLTSQGRVFTNAVSNQPLCSPYRGMLMTGMYPFSNGVLTNCNTSSRQYGNELNVKDTCFSDVLSQNGYYCGYIGKWHLDAPTYEEGPDVDRWQDAVWDTYTSPDLRRHGFKFWHAYHALARKNKTGRGRSSNFSSRCNAYSIVHDGARTENSG